jgi:hypothetical protein
MRITGALGEAGVNIKDIEVLGVREAGGAMRLAFADHDALRAAPRRCGRPATRRAGEATRTAAERVSVSRAPCSTWRWPAPSAYAERARVPLGGDAARSPARSRCGTSRRASPARALAAGRGCAGDAPRG